MLNVVDEQLGEFKVRCSDSSSTTASCELVWRHLRAATRELNDMFDGFQMDGL